MTFRKEMRRLGRERASQGRLQHTALTSAYVLVGGETKAFEGAVIVEREQQGPGCDTDTCRLCSSLCSFAAIFPLLSVYLECAEVVCLLLSLCHSCFLVCLFLNVFCP